MDHHRLDGYLLNRPRSVKPQLNSGFGRRYRELEFGLTARLNESKSKEAKRTEKEGAMRTQRAGWRILAFVAGFLAVSILASSHIFALVDTGCVFGVVVYG